MTYLILILLSLVLIFGLFSLVGYEARNSVRLFAPQRRRLDTNVDRVEFIVTHVDFSAFLRDSVRHLTHRVVHDVAHFSLLAVRTIERFLARIVRHLRAKRATTATPRETTREFVQTMSDFKDQLKETPPEIPDILEIER